MLLPTLNKAREKARAISCTNNLKQLAQSTILYCGDSNGYYPMGQIKNPNGRTISWAGVLFLSGKLKQAILVCPSFTDAQKNPANMTEWRVNSSAGDEYTNYPHYGLNRNTLNLQGNGLMNPVTGLKDTQLKTPSCTFQYGDAAKASLNQGFYIAAQVWGAVASTGTLAARHAGAINFAYYDGHVGRIQTACRGTPYTEAYNPYNLGVPKYEAGSTFWIAQ